MTPEQQREEISKAYVAAIAARCRFKLGTWSQDDDCLDVTIGAAGVLGGGTLAGPKLDVQLKCTSRQVDVHDTRVAWSLKRPHYERLRQASVVPHVLVVVVLPEEEAAWISYSSEALILRRCAYWINLAGYDPLPDGVGSTTVYIPEANLFCPESLESMMQRISRGEPL